MRVAHYFEFASWITGGIAESVRHQRKMLDHRGVDYTVSPTVKADLLHLNLMGPRSNVLARRARRRDIPVIIHTHVTAEDFANSFRGSNLLSRGLRPYLSRAYALGDRLVCPSEHTRHVLDRYVDVPSRVVSNALDPAKLDGYEPLRAEYLDRYELSPPVVFMVGHVLRRKGLATFVETARQLPSYDFVWFGPIDRRLKGRRTRRLIDSSPPNCTFPGYVEDIRGAFAVGDIFFFPTYEENEGIALLEAMYTGTPAVIRDIETFDWLDDGEDCLKATDGFDTAIERLADPELRNRLGDNAAETAAAYTIPSIAPDLVACYEEVVG